SSAFFGVINLVTRSRTQPTHAEGSVSTFGYGLGRARATGVVRFSPEAGFWATVSGLQGGAQRELYYPEYDFDPTDPNAERKANGLPSDGITRGTDRQHAGMITGRVWWKALTVQWFLNSRKKFLPTGEYASIFDDPRTRFGDTRGMIEARYEPQLTKTLQSLSRGHFNMYNFDGLTPYVPQEEGPSRDSYRGRWGGLEQRFVYTPTNDLRLTVGGEVVQHFTTRQVGVNDAGAYLTDDAGRPGRNDPFTNGAGYLNADFTPLPKLKIAAGARLDYYSNLPKFEVLPATNPRLAFIVKPYEGGVLKIMGAKAFRSPSVYELHYRAPFQIPPTRLSPEQIYSGEVELTHRFSPAVAGTLAAYSNLVEDIIVLDEVTPGVVQYRNSPAEVLIIGGESEIRREWRQGWMLGATYSYQKAQYTGGGGLRDVANSLEHLASFRGAMPILGRTLVGMTRLTIEGPRPDRFENATDPKQERTDAGVVWDLVLSGEVERMGLRYNLGIYNAMDWRYAVIPSGEFRQRQIVQNGRTLLASVTLSF
ncbi:MAG TPA: TonB-dependent receptor, partial [Labilithrix sp.]|nr:TonB-dependent receptor [Labilithrix sp.]